MSGPDFFDTNFLMYAYTPADARKQKLAQGIVGKAMKREGLVSSQVLAQFAATLLHKTAPPMQPEDGKIVAAAQLGGCGRILSDDLNAGRKYSQISAKNPFA